MRRRLFDHDEAYKRWRRGESFSAIAASCGVTANAVREAIVRLHDPQRRDELNALHRDWQRENRRKPCSRGCGRLAWSDPDRPDGICVACRREEKHEEALARDNHGTETRYSLGCHCELCRGAAAAAKRRRRERSRVPCSHGCGTLVDSINRRNPAKPPECRECARRRIAGKVAA